MAPYIQPVVQKIETTEGLASTAQFHLLMLSIELLPPLREALDIHAIEERATTHDSASLEGREGNLGSWNPEPSALRTADVTTM
jgi:hypothetical protein